MSFTEMDTQREGHTGSGKRKGWCMGRVAGISSVLDILKYFTCGNKCWLNTLEKKMNVRLCFEL